MMERYLLLPAMYLVNSALAALKSGALVILGRTLEIILEEQIESDNRCKSARPHRILAWSCKLSFHPRVALYSCVNCIS